MERAEFCEMGSAHFFEPALGTRHSVLGSRIPGNKHFFKRPVHQVHKVHFVH
jgi:hypothetical protein